MWARVRLAITLLVGLSLTKALRGTYFLANQYRVSNLQGSNGEWLDESFDMVIWDCDGVLVDSEALLKKSEMTALAKAGFTLTIDDCVRLFSGFSVDTAAANFRREMGRDLPVNFFKEQIEGSLDLFRRELVPLMKNTVNALHDADVKMCVASGSPLDRVRVSLEVGGMSHCFEPSHVFTRELVSRGKPAPDLFLYAAERMRINPSKCLVVEDSAAGIEAASAAGMACIGYLGGGHAQQSWYREKIARYNIPLAFTEAEVLERIRNFPRSS